jgi:hypothetical protein
MHAAGGFGWLGVAIITAILAGSPAQGGGCGRCGGSMAAPEPEPTVVHTPSLQSGRSRLLQRQIWRDAQQRRRTTNIALGSPSAVCVRSCDGGFFPVPDVGDRDSLAKICQALCPNADTQLYSMPLGGTIEEATSTTGSRYRDLANAGKFEQALDMNCSCRRQGQGWAEALADAEKRAQHHSGDILVTPEISEKMSRPAPEPKAIAMVDDADTGAVALAEKTGTPALVLDADGVDLDLNAATAVLSRATSGIGVEETGTAYYGLKQGEIIEQKGQDGSVKRVRIVAPTLY